MTGKNNSDVYEVLNELHRRVAVEKPAVVRNDNNEAACMDALEAGRPLTSKMPSFKWDGKRVYPGDEFCPDRSKWHRVRSMARHNQVVPLDAYTHGKAHHKLKDFVDSLLPHEGRLNQIKREFQVAVAELAEANVRVAQCEIAVRDAEGRVSEAEGEMSKILDGVNLDEMFGDGD